MWRNHTCKTDLRQGSGAAAKERLPHCTLAGGVLSCEQFSFFDQDGIEREPATPESIAPDRF